MKSSKLFLHYIIVILGLLTIESNLNAQALYPGHLIAPATNVYNYTYNQTPAQLMEKYPAGIPNTGIYFINGGAVPARLQDLVNIPRCNGSYISVPWR